MTGEKVAARLKRLMGPDRTLTLKELGSKDAYGIAFEPPFQSGELHREASEVAGVLLKDIIGAKPLGWIQPREEVL